ncbi:MAG: ABC transporter permease [Gammaproteobacteria bacterium]|nr:ABC transporter permease [Gammaproteobacteria bacterium]
MSALGIVIDSEYIRRVKSKTFLVTTLLLPIALLAIVAMIGIVAGMSVSAERDKSRAIAVFDPTGEVFEHLDAKVPTSIELTAVSGSLDALKQRVSNDEFDGLLVIPEGLPHRQQAQSVYLYTAEMQSLLVQQMLSQVVLDVVRTQRLAYFDLPRDVYDAIRRGVDFRVMEIGEAGKDDLNATARAFGLISYGMAIAIGIVMLVSIYGGMVMQAVLEEKTSRMAEILMACVRPFDLLMGKIIALFCVALTQVLAWIVLIIVLIIIASVLVGVLVPLETLGEFASAAQSIQSAGGSSLLPSLRIDVLLVTLLMIPIGCFLYASLFATIGAAFDNAQEAQQAVILPMLPLFVSGFMLYTITLAPNSLLIRIGSLVPFTSPVIMPTRMLLADVPVFEVVLSVLLAVAGAAFCGWLAGRVFRIALLRYGQKLGIRDIVRMMFGGD